jgi:glyceraldehyde 3-phosphate dehydrogenase
MIRVAISGFGRIGRNFLRTILQDKNAQKYLDVVAINIGPAKKDFIAHMFQYDTILGKYPGKVYLDGDELVIDNHRIKIIAALDPKQCDWKSLGIDWVVESSGKFTNGPDAMQHVQAGAKKVLITAPAKEEDIAIIPGVNEERYDKTKHTIVSLGSCTTNAFIPLVKVLHEAFTITRGFMTTVHAYTNSQVLLDVENKDVRKSRAAALNVIPTTTGASKMLVKIMPELEGRIQAIALRVPVAKVSLIDFVFDTKQELTVEKIHGACKKAMKGHMKNIMDITMEPLVSSDFGGTHYSVIVDGLLTGAIGSLGKIFGWYDNEWGYSERLKDFLIYVSQQT